MTTPLQILEKDSERRVERMNYWITHACSVPRGEKHELIISYAASIRVSRLIPTKFYKLILFLHDFQSRSCQKIRYEGVILVQEILPFAGMVHPGIDLSYARIWCTDELSRAVVLC